MASNIQETTIFSELLTSLQDCLLHGHARRFRTDFLLYLILWTAACISSRSVSLFYGPKCGLLDLNLNPSTLDIHSFLFVSVKQQPQTQPMRSRQKSPFESFQGSKQISATTFSLFLSLVSNELPTNHYKTIKNC